jgi:hypothetical protein
VSGASRGHVATETAQGCKQIFLDINQLQPHGINTSLGDHDNVASGEKRFTMLAKKFPQQTFETVALNGIADFSAHGKPQAGPGLTTRGIRKTEKEKKT